MGKSHAPFLCAADVCGGVDVAEAGQCLNDKKEGVVVMGADGTVAFSNAGLVRLLGWPCAELQGENVKVLMPEKFATAHDLFLQRYAEKAAAAERSGRPVLSNIVGSGRDVIARHRSGRDVRVFLMVVRLDRDAGSARDCLFLGLMTRIAAPVKGATVSTAAASAQDRRTRTDSAPGSAFSSRSAASSAVTRRRRPSRPGPGGGTAASLWSVGSGSEGSRHSIVSRASQKYDPRGSVVDVRSDRSGSVGAHARPGAAAAPALRRQKCSVLVAHLAGVPAEEAAAALADDYARFLAGLHAECAQAKGCVQCVIGDTAVCTFNAAVPNTSHRSSVAGPLDGLPAAWEAARAGAGMQLHAAAVARECLVGQWGAHDVLLGDAVGLCAAMLRVAREVGASVALIDGLQYSYQCRLVNRMTVRPGTPKAQV